MPPWMGPHRPRPEHGDFAREVVPGGELGADPDPKASSLDPGVDQDLVPLRPEVPHGKAVAPGDAEQQQQHLYMGF